MKYIFRLLLLFGSIIAFFALIGSLLPRGYDFTVETEIAANQETVFPEINQLSNWESWSHWNPDKIAGLTVNYSGEDSGVGSTQSWSEPRGEGKLWITESVANERIQYESTFANFPKMTGTIVLSSGQQAGSTRVVWSNRGRLPGGPFYGFFAPFFSTHMKHTFGESLQRLKGELENGSEIENAMADEPDAI